ncbi:hypothetical protein [Pyrobaculum sp.]|uniref:hypothetical protein n=1 Tax=Pyrobaculum sp. TaxID=2004705 RepID=UPI003D12DA0D
MEIQAETRQARRRCYTLPAMIGLWVRGERQRRRPFPGRTLYYGGALAVVRVGAVSAHHGMAYFIPMRFACVVQIVERELLKRYRWLVEVYGPDRVILVISVGSLSRGAPPQLGEEVEWLSYM